MPTISRADRLESRAVIADALVRCTTTPDTGKPIIYTILRRVSPAGILHALSIVVMVDGKPINLSHHYCRAHGRQAIVVFGEWAVQVTGSWLDVGYHLADILADLGDLPRDGFDHHTL